MYIKNQLWLTYQCFCSTIQQHEERKVMVTFRNGERTSAVSFSTAGQTVLVAVQGFGVLCHHKGSEVGFT